MKAENGIARILKSEGVELNFTYPGNIMADACREEGIKNFMMRSERFTVAVADGFSRVSNGKRFGFCSLKGSLNAVGMHMGYGALAQAYEDSTPLLCVTDGVPPVIRDVPRYNIAEAFSSVTKSTGYINQPHRVPEFMTRAYTHLRTGRLGPVLLQIPKNLGEYDETKYSYKPVKGWKFQGDPKDIKIAVRALLNAKKPMIYAGQGIFYADACNELKKFAEYVQAPVLTTLKAKSAFPEDHPLSLGVKGVPADSFLQSSDLILVIGHSLFPGRRYGGFNHQIPGTRRSDNSQIQPGKVLIHCTDDPMDINNYYQVNHAIIGDAKLVLKQLIAEVERQGGSSVKANEKLLKTIEDAKKEHREKYLPFMTSDEKPINPYRVYWELMNTIDRKNSFVTHESGGTRKQLATVYEALIPHGFMGWGTVSTLGFSLAAAIGAKIAFPDRQVVSITGDAGIGYQLGNHEALLRYKIGITTIHINNSGFSGARAPDVSQLTPSSVSNMANAMDSMGHYAERVEDPDEIAPALMRAFKENHSGKPAYLEVICSQFPEWAVWLTDSRSRE